MAPKIRYDAAEMQVKANQAAEKEIKSVTKEGVVLNVKCCSCDREGTWTSTLLMHRLENSCLRHEPFPAAEPGQQLCLWSCTLSQAERG